MRMLILVTLKRLLERALKPRRRRGIPSTHPALLELHQLAERARLLTEGNFYDARLLSMIENNVRGPGMTHEQARQFARLVQANSGEPMPDNCFKHSDRQPTFVLNETTLYLCDDCAEEQREAGYIVRPLLGIDPWGFPVVNAEDDGVLDARIIGD